MTKLSVNINKVATLRNARGGSNPDVVAVALETGYIKQEHVEMLHNWRQAPSEWGK